MPRLVSSFKDAALERAMDELAGIRNGKRSPATRTQLMALTVLGVSARRLANVRAFDEAEWLLDCKTVAGVAEMTGD